ncbi:uncharacterized protein C4orf50 homolog isoform X5 [Parus major]|uniref:uncharacterized protein C4orf50 homolog isoform X5 n=1 Tax=Parus major TaxID=9157 RepID=UPI0014447AC9|nr:uncharacterized protein C4orf50 homolog isoform X5 [Parus major]
MKELELSHKTLLVMIDRLYVKLDQVENANVRIKGKLRDIQEDLISLVENQKKSEKKHKEKLRWLQEQLKTKEDEIKSQSEYFEHYKQRQRQQTEVLRKRDCYLQGEVSRLEKQVLDLNAHIALLTSKLEEEMLQHLQQKLQSLCSGTQGFKHPGVEEMEWKTCIENVEHDVKSHLKAFQQNLKSLREKEEDTRREQADLLTELQFSQNTEDFLRTKLEESHRHVYSLKLSEIKLQEKLEELLDENRTLKDQSTVKLKRSKEKDSELTRLVDGDNRVNLNEDLIQDEVQNLKWRSVLDSHKSRATQTPVVLLCDKESEAPACSCDGLKQMEELPEELVPVLECSSSAFVKAAGLAETEQVTLGPQRANTLEDSFTLLRCTPSHHASGLLPPCSEKLPNDETKGGFYDRATELLHGKLPSTVAEIFTTSLEECNVEKHWGNKQILPKSGSMFESYCMMKEQVRKAEEELKIQQKELEKSKKEAQKWYRELGFAETRYEETKTRLMQALSELDCLKQELGDKIQGKQHCKLMPVYTLKDAQEKEVNKIASKRLEQQVLTLKAQLRDQAALQNQFRDLQNEVKLLQAQLCEKEKELQKRKSEVKLTLAPLKAKLACLTQKCQERNSFIRRMYDEFHRQGFINSAFDEEMKNLVNDMTLAEYTVAFTPRCDQEMLPSSKDVSQANGQPEDHVARAKGNRMTGSISANPQPGMDGPHSSPITPHVCAGSSVGVTSPEVIALRTKRKPSQKLPVIQLFLCPEALYSNFH